MFIRCRKSKGKYGWKEGSHQLVETYRDDGKVKQRVLASLGPCNNLDDAIELHARYVARMQAKLAPFEDAICELEGKQYFQELPEPARGDCRLHAFNRRLVLGAANPTHRALCRQREYWRGRVQRESDNLDRLTGIAAKIRRGELPPL